MNYNTMLKNVSKPGRYTGGEYGQVLKDRSEIKVRFAFCFPDTYEIGMSNLGMRILYGVLNKSDDIWCERSFAPWRDMEEKLRCGNLPLTALESGDAIKEFDFIGFTIQYELCYSNILNMLELAGIPLLAAERSDNMPIIIGGGPCTYNAEPLADFFDLFSIGEGEEVLPELMSLYIEMKDSGTLSRSEFLYRAAQIEGVYVPSLYDVSYNGDGSIAGYQPKSDDIPPKIKKRIIADMDTVYFPERFVMPYIETVHDRIVTEVYRGCIRGCRFCQAGMVCRPVREKSPEVISDQAKCLFHNTGYDEISLSSLSISDYSRLKTLVDMLLGWTQDKMINISLPSMRVDSFTKGLMDSVSSVRTGGLTFAPEAGTQRLRDVINKNISEEEILSACAAVFEAGKNQVKLYFMQGLPTETGRDLEGIAELAKKAIESYYTNPAIKRRKPPQVTVSVACFIPKPFTPFQWEVQDSLETSLEKQRFLRDKITDKKIKFNWHDAKVSCIEGIFARGDRRLSAVLLEARRLGIAFDAWDECFNYDLWMTAFANAGIDPSFYSERRFNEDDILPWDIIDCGVRKEFLVNERRKAYDGITTENCKEMCSNCGANELGGKNTWCPKI